MNTLDLDALKKEHICKIYGSLEILDVFRSESGHVVFRRKCACGKYAPHKFNNVFALNRAYLKGPSGTPLCKECHVKLTSSLTSKYEDELKGAYLDHTMAD